MIRLYFLSALFVFFVFQSASAQRIPLTQEKVKDWIENRVEAHDLQMQYKANEDKYDEVIKAYFAERNEILKANDWDPDEFDATGEWILGVAGSFESQKELDEEKAQMSELLAEYDQNEYLSEEQKEQAKEAIMQSTVERQKYIDVFKADWPAVEPYLESLEQLDDYIGGSRSEKPQLK
jgi:hypothetical protein